VWPRAASATVYVVVIWSAIIDLVGSLVANSGWLGHLSLFHYLALAPGEPVDLAQVAATTAVGLALAGLALLLFMRRDLAR
jgi:putative exporter of polyketide antibiotics